MTREEVFSILAEQGVKSVIVRYSGGNDSGGVECITLHYTDGSQKSLKEYWQQTEYVIGKGWKPIGPEPKPEEALSKALAAPVYARWGSFAGEFYVDGTILWDTVARTVTFEEQQQQQVWENCSGEF